MSPLASRRQLAVDTDVPPTLPPKNSRLLDYAEVPVSCFNVNKMHSYSVICSQTNRHTALGTPNGTLELLKLSVNDKDSSYADLDFSQVTTTKCALITVGSSCIYIASQSWGNEVIIL